MAKRGGEQGTTKDLVAIWHQYNRVNAEVGGRRDLIDTMLCIEVELARRPVRERLEAGYPK